VTTPASAVALPDPVTCALCGVEYTPGGESCRERGCPVALGACATRHCPNCGYAIPDEHRSSTLTFLRRLLGRREPMATGTVAELPAGSRGVVDRLQGDPELLTRLTAQGLAPGVAVHLLQRSPTYVIEVGETTLALERRVAEAIVVVEPGGRR